MRSAKVFSVPISVCLAFLNSFLTFCSVIKKFVEELYWKYLDILNFLKNWNVYMGAFGYIQKYTIQEEDVSLDIKMLAPR